jgi:hypothetical protein
MAFLDIAAGTLPAGNECYPQTPQELLDLYASYLSVTFDETYSLLVKGPGPIAIEDQDKVWFETTADGSPLSINNFDTLTGTWISFYPAHGTTAERPATPKDFQMFFDTDINTMLIYERADWRTADGSPGDVKFVTAASEAAALTQNPGWIVYAAAAGRVLGAAGTGAGLTARSYGDTLGEEDHTLTEAELPVHDHDIHVIWDSLNYAAEKNVAGFSAPTEGPEGAWGANGGPLTKTTETTGSGDGFNLMQPTLFLYCLIKE